MHPGLAEYIQKAMVKMSIRLHAIKEAIFILLLVTFKYAIQPNSVFSYYGLLCERLFPLWCETFGAKLAPNESLSLEG